MKRILGVATVWLLLGCTVVVAADQETAALAFAEEVRDVWAQASDLTEQVECVAATWSSSLVCIRCTSAPQGGKAYCDQQCQSRGFSEGWCVRDGSGTCSFDPWEKYCDCLF